MADITRILEDIESGEALAAARPLPLVYYERRKLATTRLAHEQPGQTLSATELLQPTFGW